MKILIDVICTAGHTSRDQWFDTEVKQLPVCRCGNGTVRAWISAPAITPQGTRAERNTDVARPATIDKKRIAEDTMFEIEQKWGRYSDPAIAEQHVSREINEAAGIADSQGNEIPIPKAPPITLANEGIHDVH